MTISQPPPHPHPLYSCELTPYQGMLAKTVTKSTLCTSQFLENLDKEEMRILRKEENAIREAYNEEYIQQRCSSLPAFFCCSATMACIAPTTLASLGAIASFIVTPLVGISGASLVDLLVEQFKLSFHLG